MLLFHKLIYRICFLDPHFEFNPYILWQIYGSGPKVFFFFFFLNSPAYLLTVGPVICGLSKKSFLTFIQKQNNSRSTVHAIPNISCQSHPPLEGLQSSQWQGRVGATRTEASLFGFNCSFAQIQKSPSNWTRSVNLSNHGVTNGELLATVGLNFQYRTCTNNCSVSVYYLRSATFSELAINLPDNSSIWSFILTS